MEERRRHGGDWRGEEEGDGLTLPPLLQKFLWVPNTTMSTLTVRWCIALVIPMSSFVYLIISLYTVRIFYHLIFALLLQFIWLKNCWRRQVRMAGRAAGSFDSYDMHGYSSYHAGAPATSALSCKCWPGVITILMKLQYVSMFSDKSGNCRVSSSSSLY